VVNIRPWGRVADLVAITGGRDDDLGQLIDEAGPAAIADLLVAEAQQRLDPQPGLSEVVIGLTISHAGRHHVYQVTFKDDQATIAPGAPAAPTVDIGYEMTDLARLLYPAHPGYGSASRKVRVRTWPWTAPGGDITEEQLQEMAQTGEITREELARVGRDRFAVLAAAIHAVICACETQSQSLSDLAIKYGSDKWGSVHWYTQHYQRNFAEVQYDPLRILEIGIGGYNYESIGGESLYTWQRFFPRALVYGLDIYAKPAVTGPRIRAVQGDQNDPAFLAELGAEAGPFDIIIDDGSHINQHIVTSFTHLFPHLRPGGWYVIEDLHTAYWPAFGGNASPGASGTSIALLKDMLDRLHQEEYLDSGHPDVENPSHPSEIVLYHNIAFLRKGNNLEEGIPAWIKNRASRWTSPGESR
jgi:MycE methyltransferase N-terminal